MKWTNLVLLGAISLAASGSLIWTATRPTSEVAAADPVFPPAMAADFTERSADQPHPHRDTRMLESRLDHPSLQRTYGSRVGTLQRAYGRRPDSEPSGGSPVGMIFDVSGSLCRALPP